MKFGDLAASGAHRRRPALAGLAGAAFLSVAVLGAACTDRSPGDGEEGSAPSAGEAEPGWPSTGAA